MPVSIAAIKIAQQQAALPDAQYRELLNRVAGASSSKDLTPEQRVDVYREIMRLVRRRNATQNGTSATSATTPTPHTPMVRKLYALFYQLLPSLPDVHSRQRWLLGFVAKVNNLDTLPPSLDTAPPSCIFKAIEALKQRIRQHPGAPKK